MGIIAYITSVSRSCRLSSGTAVDVIFDIGFTFVNDGIGDGIILNNGISLSSAEVPDGVIIAVDPYGRIFGKIGNSSDPGSRVKLVLDYSGDSFECEISLHDLSSANVSKDYEFTEIQDEGGGGGESSTPSN